MNAVYRWSLTVERALMLYRWGRPTPMSGDHQPPTTNHENGSER